MFVFQRGNRLRAVAYRAAVACVNSSASLHYRLGTAHARLGKWPAARDSFVAALARNRKRADWHFALGLACEKMKHWHDAERAYAAALARDDTDPAMHWRLGLVRAKLRDWRAAAEAFEGSVARDPENVEYNGRLAEARCKLKDWAGAASAFDVALAGNPESATIHGRVGVVRIKLKDWLAAATAFEAALALDPSDALCHERLGFVRSKLGHWNRAVAAYEAAVAREPDNAAWLGDLGWARMRLGNWPGAVAAFEAAIEREPEDAALHSRLGSARAKLRDWPGALAAYQAAIGLDEGNIDLHQRLANILFRAQNWSGAAESFARVFEAGSDDDLVRYRLAYCRANSGRKKDARALVQPFEKMNDACLEAFLEQEQSKGRPASHAKTELLFVPGAHTALARKVSLGTPEDGEKTYFEHMRVGASRCRRTVDFYEGLGKDASTAFLRYVPKLHFHALEGQYGYFLFEFLEHAAFADWAPVQRMALEDERFGNTLIDALAELARTDIPVKGASPDERLPRSSVVRDVGPYVKGQASLHTHEPAFVAGLERLAEHWCDHRTMYEGLPRVLAHRHLHDKNIAVSAEGKITILDWEIYGYAPVGFDLVMLFRDNWEHEQFAPLANRYFDHVCAHIPDAERSYVISLLIAQESVLLQKPIPQKWLHHISAF